MFLGNCYQLISTHTEMIERGKYQGRSSSAANQRRQMFSYNQKWRLPRFFVITKSDPLDFDHLILEDIWYVYVVVVVTQLA